jgi:hypothetical protein
MDADFFEKRENMMMVSVKNPVKGILQSAKENFEKTFCGLTLKVDSGDGTRCSCYPYYSILIRRFLFLNLRFTR